MQEEKIFKVTISQTDSILKDSVRCFPTLAEASEAYLHLLQERQDEDCIVVSSNFNSYDAEISVSMEICGVVTLVETVKLVQLDYCIKLANDFQNELSNSKRDRNGRLWAKKCKYNTTNSKALKSLAMAVKREIAKQEKANLQ